jgi:hypothetical protein
MLRTETVITVECQEWDRFVQETYGRPYCFQQQDGCKERGTFYLTVPMEDAYDFECDEIPEVVNYDDQRGVSFKAWLERDPTKTIPGSEKEGYDWMLRMWWHRNFYPDVQMIANDLHKRGLMKAGDYMIIIDW